MTNDQMTDKKYVLKPGKHQFAPGSPATHHNDNLSDAEAEWYLKKYPHIAALFENQSFYKEDIKIENNTTREEQCEHLTPSLEGQEATI